MNIEIARPYAFYALLLLVPSFLYTLYHYTRLLKSLKNNFNTSSTLQEHSFRRLRYSLIIRELLRAVAWICLVLSYAGISWGAEAVPVPKAGSAVSFVFDISYSMNAKDAPEKNTRLQAATSYANELLERMSGTSVSVVLAKGEGIIAVPLTEDRASIKPLLATLSPRLMSAAGSSLGKGIEEAIRSFPVQSSSTASIWVFTDGEETDSKMANALSTALKYGISVIIIGFGSESESEVYAGDGTTIIKTALRSKKIRDTIKSIQAKKTFVKRNKGVKTATLDFVDATELGSALKVLSSISSSSSDRQHVSYEEKTISREGLFISLAILFFILSFIVGEFDWTLLKRREIMLASLCLLPLFTSCSSSFDGSKHILEGTWNYHQKKYRQATADFLRAVEGSSNNSFLREYALYGLASTYLMQNESEASLSRFEQIAPNAPDAVLFSTYYNMGIISHRKGNYAEAASYFKKALLINSSDTNAKINLELSIQQREESKSRAGEQQLLPINEAENARSAEDAVFSVIQENDKKQWKNQEKPQNQSLENDY